MWQIVGSMIASEDLPPGPRRWPVFGCMFSLKQPLHLHFAELSRKHGPLLFLKVGMMPLVVVNDAQTAKEVLKKCDLEFAYRPPTKVFDLFSLGFSDLILAPYGQHWKLMRKSTVNLFSTSSLNANAWHRESELQALVAFIKGSPGVSLKLRKMLSLYNSKVVFMLMFGTTPPSADLLVNTIDEVMSLLLNINIGELFPALDWLDLHGINKKLKNKLMPQLISIVKDIIHQAKGSHEKACLSDILLRLQDEGTISEASVVSTLTDMIFAGVETSQAVTEWAIAEVINNSEVMKLAQEELDSVVGSSRLVRESDLPALPYIEAIFKETLRLHPPATLGVPHFNPKKSHIGGYIIPAKSTVFINLWAIGRDPANWDEPNLFKPERFLDSDISLTGRNFELIPFSSGRRICAGYPLALRSIPLIVATLIHAFSWSNNGPINLEEEKGVIACKLATKLEPQAQPRLQECAYGNN